MFILREIRGGIRSVYIKYNYLCIGFGFKILPLNLLWFKVQYRRLDPFQPNLIEIKINY